MHYEEYKLKDPGLVSHMLRTFPFAAILVNTPWACGGASADHFSGELGARRRA